MALRDLKTGLKSLKFGNDRPGGGDSGEPYIVTPLPENATGLEKIGFDVARYSQDFPLRGGGYALRASVEDTIRITKFIGSAPKGVIFIAKQIGLQLSNPKIESSNAFLGIGNTRIYNGGINTLAQIPVEALGGHIVRHGLLPISDDHSNYAFVVGAQNRLNDSSTNRLVNLFRAKVRDNTVPSLGLLSTAINTVKLGIDPINPNTLIRYFGGPDSFLGIGETVIKRYTTTPKVLDREISFISGSNRISITNVNVLNNPFLGNVNIPLTVDLSKFEQATKKYQLAVSSSKSLDSDTPLVLRGIRLSEPFGPLTFDKDIVDSSLNVNGISTFIGHVMPYNLLMKQRLIKSTTKFVDYRQTLVNNNIGKGVLPYSDYENLNIATRIGTGNPGARIDRVDYTATSSIGEDRVNMIPLYKNDGSPFIKRRDGLNKSEVFFDGDIGKQVDPSDMIKFVFEGINSNAPAESTKAHFRAYITNLGDGNEAEWDQFRYQGRGDTFYNYRGFSRQIAFTMKVAAATRQEMKVLYQKINYLVSNTLPDYNDQGAMRGSFIKLTIGDYIFRMPGKLDSVRFNIDDSYPWEIALTQNNKYIGDPSQFISNDQDGDDNMLQLPHMLDINISFTPISNMLGRKGVGIPTITPDTQARMFFYNDFIGSNNETSIKVVRPAISIDLKERSSVDNTEISNTENTNTPSPGTAPSDPSSNSYRYTNPNAPSVNYV